MEGLLSKANVGWSLTGWTEKYFVLTETQLLMYASETKKTTTPEKPEWQVDTNDISRIQYSPPAAFGEGNTSPLLIRRCLS